MVGVHSTSYLTGTGVPVGLLVLQCQTAGQVLARGGPITNGGTCIQTLQNPQTLMRAIPIADNEEGTLEFKSINGQEYVKVYDPLLNVTRWQAWEPPPAAAAAAAVQPSGTPGTDKNLLSKLTSLASAGVVADPDSHPNPPSQSLHPTTSDGAARQQDATGNVSEDEATIASVSAAESTSSALRLHLASLAIRASVLLLAVALVF